MAERFSVPRGPAADRADAHVGKADAPATARVICSTVLFGGQQQLAIQHNQTIYFLRQTRSGKLILTK